jgi:hypothetical protein
MHSKSFEMTEKISPNALPVRSQFDITILVNIQRMFFLDLPSCLTWSPAIPYSYCQRDLRKLAFYAWPELPIDQN